MRQLGRINATEEIAEPHPADVEELTDVGHIDMVPAINLLWADRRLLGRAALVGLVLAGLMSILIPNQYESTVQLMPPDPQSAAGMALMASMASSAGLPSAATGVASSLLGMKSSGASFVGILKSRTVQDDLINRFDLRRVYWYKHYDDTRKKLASRTNIDEDKKTGIITIQVSDRDRQRARDLAAAYVAELDKLSAQLNTSSARRERIFLEGRLSEVKRDLDAAAVDLGQFSSKNATLDLQSEGKAMVESAAVLQGNLIAAESELRGLQAIYTDNNARVRGLRARVDELRNQLQKMAGTPNFNLGADLPPEQLYPSLRQLPVLGVRYLDLYRRLKIQETVFEALTKQYEIAKVEEAKEIPTVKVLDAANIPERKSFPPRLLIIFLGMLFSMALVSAWLILQRHWVLIDEADPGKRLAKEVWETTRRAAHRVASKHAIYLRNGTGSAELQINTKESDTDRKEEKTSRRAW